MQFFVKTPFIEKTVN